ncbi:MAG: hypothetical protein K2M95_04955 [Clostridiales bacterium]|nr:hypothetical protein [Clostridiales bacterium]
MESENELNEKSLDDAKREKNGIISKKQYKFYWACFWVLEIFFGLVACAGLFIAMIIGKKSTGILGMIMMIGGSVFVVFFGFFFIIKYAAKIQMYRLYRDHPEEFDR